MSFENFTIPILTVNQYLWYTMLEIEPDLDIPYGTTIPFFPLSDSAGGYAWSENEPYIIYDRMLRISGRAFYPIKKDHFLYAVKGQDIASLQWASAIQYILDRQDDVAQDINAWNRDPSKWFPETGKVRPDNVYFHHLRVFQTERTSPRDWSIQNNYITEFVVEAEYHFTDSVEDYLSS